MRGNCNLNRRSRRIRAGRLVPLAALCVLAQPALAQADSGTALVALPADPAKLLASGSRFEPAIGPIPQASLPPAPHSDVLPIMVEASDDFAQRAPGCGLSRSDLQGARAVTTCPFVDLSTGLNISTSLGGFETHARFARGFVNPWTSQNLLTADTGTAGLQSTTALVGFSGAIAGGRIGLRGDQAWSTSWRSPFYAQPVPMQRRNELTGRASWFGVDARLIQSGRLTWSVAVDYSSVGERFFSGQSMALRTAIALPGERLTLSSKIKLGTSRFALANDRYRSSFGSSTANRLGFSREGISFSLASREFDSGTVTGLGPLSSRAHTLSASVDLSVDEASSGVLARLGQSALFPRTLSLTWRNGWTENSLTGSADRFLRKSWSISAGWESRLGETQLDYSQDRRIGLSAALGSREESTFQLSHMVRWHGWRAGIDGTVTRSTSSKTSGYGATSYSAGSTLAYQVTDGPEFTLQLGRDHDRMTLNDRSYLSANDGTRLTASLDLTAWLNHRFARKDLRFRFEFRKLLEARQEERLDPEQQLFDRLYDRRDRDVVQVSFGMVF